jgi:hypothetical protein
MEQSENVIRVDIDKLTLDDLPLLALFDDKSAAGQTELAHRMGDVLAMLDRAVIGGIIGKGYPLRTLGEIMAQISSEMQKAQNPKN